MEHDEKYETKRLSDDSYRVSAEIKLVKAARKQCTHLYLVHRPGHRKTSVWMLASAFRPYILVQSHSGPRHHAWWGTGWEGHSNFERAIRLAPFALLPSRQSLKKSKLSALVKRRNLDDVIIYLPRWYGGFRSTWPSWIIRCNDAVVCTEAEGNGNSSLQTKRLEWYIISIADGPNPEDIGVVIVREVFRLPIVRFQFILLRHCGEKHKKKATSWRERGLTVLMELNWVSVDRLFQWLNCAQTYVNME